MAMIRFKGLKLSFSFSFLIAMLIHLVILLFVKKNDLNYSIRNFDQQKLIHPLRLNNIKLIKPSELEHLRRVGIKNGVKRSDFIPDLKEIPKVTPPTPQKGLSLQNLTPEFQKYQKHSEANKTNADSKKAIDSSQKSAITSTSNSLNLNYDHKSTNTHFYFNPKKEKQITQNQEQENLKRDALNHLPLNSTNPITRRMSNFEIRYERPDGVSEDELNSDEKAFYSFFKRSYENYLTKLYATYEKVSLEKPELEKDFNNKHLLIGRVDYDENGNIVLVKIIKSSESDNVHYFFEETLKQLNLINPPKSFTKSKKRFSTFYQIQIN